MKKSLLRRINYHYNATNALTPASGISHYTKSDNAFDWSISSLPAILKLEKHPLLAGWYMIEIIIAASEQYLDCKLKVDYDDGSFRTHTFMVINQHIMKRVLLLKRGFKHITLIPSEKAVSFSMRKMSFVKLTTGAAYKFMHKKLLTYKPNHDFKTSLHLWRHYELLYNRQHKSETDYQDWINRREFNQLKRALHLTQTDSFCFVIDATHSADLDAISQSLDSIRCQTYTLWQAIVIAPFRDIELAESVLMTSVHASSENVTIISKPLHINSLFETLLNTSHAKYFITAEPGTIFSPHALSAFARYQNEHPDNTISYSDHDAINGQGERYSPFLKPDWNPDLMLSTNYIGSTIAFNRQLLTHKGNNIQLFTSLFAWVYEVLIKAAIKNLTLPGHIQEILYHSPSHSITVSPLKSQNQLKILNQSLAFHGTKATKTSNDGVFKIEWPLPNNLPLISIIIPTKDNLPTLMRAIESIISYTAYTNYEILIVNNQSQAPQTLNYYKSIELDHRVSVLSYDKPFNYSAINNYAVQHTKGSFILLLNDDVEVINKQWLGELLRHAHREDIGCVGAKLFYPDGRIQHGGVIVGLSGCAGHSHKFYPSDDPGYMQRLLCTQNYSAVTAACLLVKKEHYLEVGGLNEKHLSVAFNDVDFCLKVQALGYRNIWTPWAKLYHYESLSRGQDNTKKKRKRLTSEIQFMKQTWNTTAYEDPHYNKRLTTLREDFGLGF
ncbi:glycosyltransferase family 2 protein [Leucothrix arctica]|uniref:Glycosyltransferase 2-like domain-containing protein n=1 Tax=Leucothrix arctica TaxID=1481894 RepID=A0A317CJN2_9GAMM|nr:glycosyltransferase [Leucothrix arctica]PWQ98696.1 hypothetical protein DKT75_02480 [Leucothrix arctica]